MKYYLIYKITNLLNGKIYVGKHETYDLDDGYMGSGNLIKKAISKYGIDNFKKEIIKYCIDEADLFKSEAEIVTEEFCKRKDTYNINVGGAGGWYYINSNHLQGDGKAGRESIKKKLKNPIYHANFCRKMKEASTKEVRLKISKNVKEHIQKFGHTWLGRNHSKQTKEKMSNTFQTHNHQKGIKNSQYGHIWVYNEELKNSKSIPKDQFIIYERLGYKKGRKIKF